MCSVFRTELAFRRYLLVAAARHAREIFGLRAGDLSDPTNPARRLPRFTQIRVIAGLLYFYVGVTSANARGARYAQL